MNGGKDDHGGTISEKQRALAAQPTGVSVVVPEKLLLTLPVIVAEMLRVAVEVDVEVTVDEKLTLTVAVDVMVEEKLVLTEAVAL